MPITPTNQPKNIAVVNTHNKTGYALWGDNEVTWGDEVLTWGAPTYTVSNADKHLATPTNQAKS